MTENLLSYKIIRKMDKETYNRICNKLEMADLPLTSTLIRHVYKEHLKAKEFNKTPLEK